jgi:hypothetical protein
MKTSVPQADRWPIHARISALITPDSFDFADRRAYKVAIREQAPTEPPRTYTTRPRHHGQLVTPDEAQPAAPALIFSLVCLAAMPTDGAPPFECRAVMHPNQTQLKEPKMPNTLVIDTSKYAIYVRVLQGQGDGTLVTIDSHGHIHVGPGDPAGLRDKIQAAVKQIQAGADAFNAAVANQHIAA